MPNPDIVDIAVGFIMRCGLLADPFIKGYNEGLEKFPAFVAGAIEVRKEHSGDNRPDELWHEFRQNRRRRRIRHSDG